MSKINCTFTPIVPDTSWGYCFIIMQNRKKKVKYFSICTIIIVLVNEINLSPKYKKAKENKYITQHLLLIKLY